MRHLTISLLLAATLAAPLAAQAGKGEEAVVGSIIGGATGAIIGNGLGGRDGAIVGGAIGAAAGVAIATDRDRHSHRDYERDRGYREVYRRDDWDDDRRYRDYDRGYRREVVVVESPRHYYRGNEFVYGYPSHDRWAHHPGRGHGYGRRYRDRGPDVIIIERDRRW